MNQPQSVRLERDSIRILWADGHEGFYPHWYLRASCPCVDCRDSAGNNWVVFYEGIPQDVRALDWMPIGQYAAEFLWSDGHATGLYAFETLRRLCRCDACMSKLFASRHPEEE